MLLLAMKEWIRDSFLEWKLFIYSVLEKLQNLFFQINEYDETFDIVYIAAQQYFVFCFEYVFIGRFNYCDFA